MMPSPSTGALTTAKTMYRGGEMGQGEGERDLGRLPEQGGRPGGGRGRGIPAEKEKEQLRRNLSLLKKKMHSQAGSRRSQVRVPAGAMGDFFFSVPVEETRGWVENAK